MTMGLLKSCSVSSLIIGGILLPYGNILKVIKTSPEGDEENQICYIIENKWKNSLHDVGTTREANCRGELA